MFPNVVSDDRGMRAASAVCAEVGKQSKFLSYSMPYVGIPRGIFGLAAAYARISLPLLPVPRGRAVFV